MAGSGELTHGDDLAERAEQPTRAPSRGRRQFICGGVRLLGDLAAITLAFALATLNTHLVQSLLLGRDDPHLFYTTFLHDRIAALSLLSALLIGWLLKKGHYSTRHPAWIELKQIVFAVFALLVLDAALQYVFKAAPSRLWLLQTWLFLFVLLPLGRVATRLWLSRVGRWAIPSLVIGTERSIPTVERLLGDNRSLGYRVVECVNIDTIGKLAATDCIVHAINEHRVAHVIVAFDEETNSALNHVARHLNRYHQDLSFSFVPALNGLSLIGLEVQKFIGQEAIMLTNTRPGGLGPRLLVKRMFDWLMATLLTVALAPLMLLIALGVKADGGPVFYKPIRVGRHGRLYSCFKFRTMVPDAEAVLQRMLASDPELQREWQAKFKLRDDPRVTRLGRFLRKSSLDELPQLINVIWGDMSLVGPRPISRAEAEQVYVSDLDLYTAAKPGITGLWQVSGRDELSYDERIELNNWYMRNWSFWSDMVILLKTFVNVLTKRGVS